MDHHHHHSDPLSGPESSGRNIIWSHDEDDVARNLLQARSNYSCSFCKRGFSNAQALGGHMNIHRRDRAKLKQEFSCENNLLSLDIAKSSGCEEIMRGPPDDDSSTGEKLRSTSCDDHKADGDPILRGLPLFVEAPPPGDGGDDHHHHHIVIEEEEAKVDDGLRFGGEVLDLELRLGPLQPNYYSKPNT